MASSCRCPTSGPSSWTRSGTRPEVVGEFRALQQIRWRKFTDNFIIMYSASTMDWFSDPDWECVLHNVGLCAKAAKVGNLKGLCFDLEPYGDNPWLYSRQPRAKERSFEEYQAIVRRRGAQMMAEIQKYLPAPVSIPSSSLPMSARPATWQTMNMAWCPPS